MQATAFEKQILLLKIVNTCNNNMSYSLRS